METQRNEELLRFRVLFLIGSTEQSLKSLQEKYCRLYPQALHLERTYFKKSYQAQVIEKIENALRVLVEKGQIIKDQKIVNGIVTFVYYKPKMSRRVYNWWKSMKKKPH